MKANRFICSITFKSISSNCVKLLNISKAVTAEMLFSKCVTHGLFKRHNMSYWLPFIELDMIMFLESEILNRYRIWGPHSGGWEEFRLVEYNAMWSVETQPEFQRNIRFFTLFKIEYYSLLPALCWFLAWISVVGWGIMLQAGRSRVRVPMRSLNFFQLT
jgi:hypothetical protein